MFEAISSHVTRLARDDRGADLVEYGLLASVIALAGVVVFPTIFDKLADAFGDGGNDVYDAWEPPNPDSWVPPDP